MFLMMSSIMNKNINSPNHLTEFAPHSDDVKPPGNFISRLFRRYPPGQFPQAERDLFTQSENMEDDETDDDRNSADENGVDTDSHSEASVTSSSNQQSASLPTEPPPPRTRSNVLNRLSRIVARPSQTPQAYRDSDFKQYWMPDRNCRECYECGMKFHALRRRHHCRICGQIFCSQCCNQKVPGNIMGYTGFLRACTYCSKVVLQYAQNPEVQDDIESIDDGDLNRASSASLAACNNAPSTESLLSLPTESPSRFNSANNTPSTTQRRLSKTARLPSIFDEDAKQRRRNNVGVDPSMPGLLDTLQLERTALLQDANRLHDLWQSMKQATDGVNVQCYRHRLRTYTDCMVGTDITDWLLANDKASSREQAVMLGQALVDAKCIVSTTINDAGFRDDHTFYRPCDMPLREDSDGLTSLPNPTNVDLTDDEDGPLWVKEIHQQDEDDDVTRALSPELPTVASGCESTCSELDAANSSVFYVDSPMFIGTLQRPHKEQRTSADCNHIVSRDSVESASTVQSSVEVGLLPVLASQQRATTLDGVIEPPVDTVLTSNEVSRLDSVTEDEENEEQTVKEQLLKLHTDHLTQLVCQLLESRNLSLKWSDTILNVTRRVSQTVRPDIRNDGDDMDIRQYVTMKVIPGGQCTDTAIINGVVCTKTVAHRKMKQQITNPKILLLRSPIEYQRVENKFSSLEPQILQEHEYLRNCIGRIATLQPDILLVEKTVSRLAQGFLLDAGITLVLNVKASVMERVARFTQATIVTSIDGLVNKTTLGCCQNFYVQTVSMSDGSTKSLMYFDGCAKNLGCTVTLRGAAMSELKAVKRLMRFMTYAMYNAHLETSFLFDEYASVTTCKLTDAMMSPPAGDVEFQSVFTQHTMCCTESIDADTITPSNHLADIDHMTSTPSIHVADTGNVANQALSDDHMTSTPSNQMIDICHVTGDTCPKLQICENMYRRDSALVTDFSDPLQHYERSRDESVFHCSVPLSVSLSHDMTRRQHTECFRRALEDTVLSISPCVPYSLPYLETEAGCKCTLRTFFPEQIYWSRHFEPDGRSHIGRGVARGVANAESDSEKGVANGVTLLPAHAFIVEKLTAPPTDPSVQLLLYDYRARGCRIPLPTINTCNNTNSGPQTKRRKSNNNALSSETGSPLPVDCLDPFSHQRFLVLFSSFSPESAIAPVPCVLPWVVSMEYYGRNDVTLGGFLERYCFRETYRCSNRCCETPMMNHTRRFVHGTGCLQVMMRKLDIPMAGTADTIYTWTYCRKCKEGSPVTTLSRDSWSMSFAKYLELRFYAGSYVRRSPMSTDASTVCQHSLHHEHYQYFGCQLVVASFRYSAITLKEVVLPSAVIPILPVDVTLQQLEDEGKMLNFQAKAVFLALLEQLHRLKKDSLSDTQSHVITEHVIQLEVEHESVMQKVEYVQSLILNMKRVAQQDVNLGLQIQDAFVDIKHQVAELVTSWNERIHEFEVQLKKPADRSKVSSSAGSVNISKQSTSTSLSGSLSITVASSLASAASDSAASSYSDSRLLTDDNELTVTNFYGDESENVSVGVSLAANLPNTTPSTSVSSVTDDQPITPAVSSVTEDQPITPAVSSVTEDQPITPAVGSDNKSAVFVENLSVGPTDAENQPTTVTDSQPTVVSSCAGAVLDTVNNCPVDVDISHTTGEQHLSASSVEAVDELLKCDDVDNSLSQFTASQSHKTKNINDSKKTNKTGGSVSGQSDLEKKDRTAVVKQMFTSLLSGSGNTTVQIPFPSDEHHLLAPCQKVPVVVYDQEPSSVIAYTLSSLEYEQRLQELRILITADETNATLKRSSRPVDAPQTTTTTTTTVDIDVTDAAGKKGVLSFLKGASSRDKSPHKSGSKCEVDAVKYTPRSADNLEDSDDVLDSAPSLMDSQKSTGKSLKQQPLNYHIEIQFNDSSTKFYCRVYFADQFCKLRKLIFPDGEERYIRSLSRCFTWLARGGKSGSSFCKTQDDRFILKQMSRYEVQSFNEFAPHYFEYITNAHSNTKPTVLAKIVGVYKIVYQNTKTSTALKQDLLVMENLFYNRKITQIFDLKGSARNRLVSTSGKRVEDLVLLDENLLKVSVDNPLYVYPHSKAVLTAAITHDTQFLATHSVMDYSLLVGLDDNSSQLVIGIIDYIRTFTWDKMLEMLVKRNLIGAMPTVVSPELYRQRFLEAMDKYFLFVPDRWTGHGRSMES